MGQGDCVTGGRKGQWMLSQHRNMLTDWIIINKQKIYPQKTNIPCNQKSEVIDASVRETNNVTDLIVIGGAKERRALH